jgi:hypothetical protein
MAVTVRSSEVGELAANPELIQQAGTATVIVGTGSFVMSISTLNEIVAAPDADLQLTRMLKALREQELLAIDDDYDENEEMVSLRTDKTGVDNVVFVSPRGRARHGPRIKIAIDPPQSLNPSTITASMSIDDYSVRGAYMPVPIAQQAMQFIKRNHAVLLAYWNYEIDTAQLFERLQPPP